MLTRSPATAEEIVQEAFARLHALSVADARRSPGRSRWRWCCDLSDDAIGAAIDSVTVMFIDGTFRHATFETEGGGDQPELTWARFPAEAGQWVVAVTTMEDMGPATDDEHGPAPADAEATFPGSVPELSTPGSVAESSIA